jgi:hypothetical protein
MAYNTIVYTSTELTPTPFKIKAAGYVVLTFNVESGIAHIFGGLNLCGITFLI